MAAQLSGAPTAVEITPSAAGSFSVPFTAVLPLSVNEFEVQRAGYVSAVAQATGVDASAVLVLSVTLEPVLAPVPVFNESNATSNSSLSSPSSPTGRRLLSVTTVLVQTEVEAAAQAEAEAAAAGLTVDSLTPLLAAEGVPPASIAETPRVVLGAVAALPASADTVNCTLSITWDEIVRVKVAERGLTCASAAAAAAAGNASKGEEAIFKFARLA